MNKPNILFITIDALRADVLGCYGAMDGSTPNIDNIADNGFRFEQAITGGSWTQAAFPVIFSSTYASWYGGCLGPLSALRPSPVEVLASHGYTTVGFSTNPHLSQKSGYGRGFQRFFDLIPPAQDIWLRKVRGGQRLLYRPAFHSIARLLGFDSRPPRLYVSAEDLTDRILKESEDLQGPFFLWAHYMDVHWPNHLQKSLTNPGAVAQAWEDLTHLNKVNRKGLPMSPEKLEYYKQLYRKALKYTDSQVGRLLDGLNQSNLLNNTIIILVSDHGEEFYERDRWGHVERNVYDEIVRVPLLIQLPGVEKGKTFFHQVSTLDIMPTILDLCGIIQQSGLQGRSLVPLWKNSEGSFTNRPAICEMRRDDRHIVAVRTPDYKYIWDSKTPHEPLLYDLRADPLEKVNICDKYHDLHLEFQAIVDKHCRLSEETRPVGEATHVEHDQVVIQRLRDLGYVD